MKLPPAIDVAAFDALHDEPARWQDVIASIAAGHSRAPVRQVEEGTVLVGLVGDELVVKLYPPFLRDHFEFERQALGQLRRTGTSSCKASVRAAGSASSEPACRPICSSSWRPSWRGKCPPGSASS